MDIATVIGLIAGVGCIIAPVMMGTDAKTFIHVPSMAIVVGGMTCSTLIHFSLGQVLNILAVVRKTLFYRLPGEGDLVQKMVNYSAINRRDGALALERQIPSAGDDFLIKGLQMVIDGQSEEAIEKQLYLEIQYLQERHADGKKILEFMGASAPAFGMIGTLIGLVQMLGTLNDPSQIGGGMATALITTFYGAFMANLLFLPMAGKLGIRSKKETLVREMIVEGLLGIVRGESPTGVREKMQAFVSERNREEYKPSI
ncbi:MAG TPA: MotA/TolQ/ExbB proton channel family protein [Phycisphaerae bacterium]|nr:MotA/TolQ/ExbB proton channel family protein [Phycisphaerae bacterium]